MLIKMLRDWLARIRAASPDPDPRFFGAPDDIEGVWDAPERLKAPDFLLSTPHALQWERANWAHVDPRLMYWAALFIENARKRGIPLYVHCALRDRVAQTAHFAKGTSKVRYPNSAHNIGEAVDIVHGLYHWEMSRQEWALLGVLGKLALDRVNAQLRKDDKLHLTWGGDWAAFWDPAHWEISDYKTRRRILPSSDPVTMTPRHILRNYRP